MIKDRIKKLLNLARDKGASEHEAARALELATALMIRHGIEAKDVDDTPKLGSGAFLSLDDRWHWFAARAVATLYGAIPLFSSKRNGFAFVGRLDNVEACEITLAYVVDQIEQLYKVALPAGLSKSERSDFRRTFKQACALRVLNRAVDIVATFEEKGMPECTALVVQDHRKTLQQEAHDFVMRQAGVKARNTSLSVKVSAGSILGHLAGDRVKLNREVE